jgi:hypothetical protein
MIASKIFYKYAAPTENNSTIAKVLKCLDRGHPLPSRADTHGEGGCA